MGRNCRCYGPRLTSVYRPAFVPCAVRHAAHVQTSRRTAAASVLRSRVPGSRRTAEMESGSGSFALRQRDCVCSTRPRDRRSRRLDMMSRRTRASHELTGRAVPVGRATAGAENGPLAIHTRSEREALGLENRRPRSRTAGPIDCQRRSARRQHLQRLQELDDCVPMCLRQRVECGP